MKPEAAFDPLRIMSMPAVSASFGGLTPSPIYQLVRDGLLTEPVICGFKKTGWPAGEVRAILAARIKGQGEDEIRKLVIELETQRSGIPATPRRDKRREAHRDQMRAKREAAALEKAASKVVHPAHSSVAA